MTGGAQRIGTASEARATINLLYDRFFSLAEYDLADTLFASDLQIPAFHGEILSGPQHAIALVQAWHAGFSDISEHAEQIVVDGDQAMAFFHFSGTHIGPFGGVRASGRPVEMRGADWFRFVDGKIAEWRYVEDRLGLAVGMGQIAPQIAVEGWPFASVRDGE